MTAQIPEKIMIDGETLSMCTEPLSDYFELSGKPVKFAASSTALWHATACSNPRATSPLTDASVLGAWRASVGRGG